MRPAYRADGMQPTLSQRLFPGSEHKLGEERENRRKGMKRIEYPRNRAESGFNLMVFVRLSIIRIEAFLICLC